MDGLFAASYIFLAALLAWEMITVHTILRKSAKMRFTRRQRQRDAASRILVRISSFRSKLFGMDGGLSASDLKGVATALLFVDQDVESERSVRDMQALLSRIHRDRRLLLFVCTRRDESSVDITNLVSLAGQFSGHSLASLYDRDFAAAKDFQINVFPTLLLVGPDGSVQRTWTNLHICSGGKNKPADKMSVAPVVAQPLTKAET